MPIELFEYPGMGRLDVAAAEASRGARARRRLHHAPPAHVVAAFRTKLVVLAVPLVVGIFSRNLAVDYAFSTG